MTRPLIQSSLIDTNREVFLVPALFDSFRLISWSILLKPDEQFYARIEKTVFIKAQRSLPYGEVVKVIDGIKGAGANPIGLQLDNLN